ncbi:MAG: TIGR02281 family clan AA aspartic protease, partial [Alphaproteobacteria bacterium CG11_big_fil_rev_8_21_14_0_20_44_7]
GHYHIDTEINGVTIKFMVDTGASDVVLTKNDAKKLGINLHNLDYTKMYNTANGITYGAPIVINKIKIDNFVIYNIKASVNNSEMEQSLLGMSFLDKLGGYEVRNGILTLWVK